MLDKKKLLILIIFLILNIFEFSYSVKAEIESTIFLESNKQFLENGEEIEVTVNIENTKIAAFDLNLHFDSKKLEIVSSPENSNVVDDRIIFVWYDEKGGENSKQEELASFKFKAIDEGIANFAVDGNCYTEKGENVKIDFKELQIQIGEISEENINLELQKQKEEVKQIDEAKNNAKLQFLRIDKEGLNPNFSNDIFNYYLTVDNSVNKIDILAVPENANAKVEITGNYNLVDGLNVVKIQVTSQDESIKNIYEINITKTKNLEAANTNLETLAIENELLYPEFNNDETTYKVEVSNEVTKLNLLAIPENEKASISVLGNEDLKEGNNDIKILVTAENGFTKKEIIIKVYKRSQSEEEAYLTNQAKKEELLKNAYTLEKIYKSEEQEIVQEENIVKNEDYNKESYVKNIGKFVLVVIIFLVIVIIIHNLK